jgi:nicotinamide riboside transporter PnuC
MEILSLLYQPYIISILIAIIITVIIYFTNKNNSNEEEDEKNQKESNKLSQKLIYVFIISYLLSTAFLYAVNYLRKNNVLQKGGEKKIIDPLDSLTMISDDVEVGLLES